MSKTIPWGSEASPRGESVPVLKIRGNYSSFSSGPIFDTTPHEGTSIPTISPFETPARVVDTASSYGPEYGLHSDQSKMPAMDSNFSKLENKLEHKQGITNPAGLAAKIGREELGQSEMTRRSIEGRKKS